MPEDVEPTSVEAARLQESIEDARDSYNRALLAYLKQPDPVDHQGLNAAWERLETAVVERERTLHRSLQDDVAAAIGWDTATGEVNWPSALRLIRQYRLNSEEVDEARDEAIHEEMLAIRRAEAAEVALEEAQERTKALVEAAQALVDAQDESDALVTKKSGGEGPPLFAFITASRKVAHAKFALRAALAQTTNGTP